MTEDGSYLIPPPLTRTGRVFLVGAETERPPLHTTMVPKLKG